MKNDEHFNETKTLLKKSKFNSIKIEENPLLSSKLISFLKIVNISTLLYILISTIFYFVIHHYGKRVIKTKATRIEYENLLYQNLFVNLYFAFTSILGFITIKKRSLYYFSFYYLTLVLYSTLFLISYFSNCYADFLINNKFIWYSFNILIVVCLIFIYLVYHFVYIIHHNKKYIENSDITSSNIIHEIYLRTDMLKISFNHMIIKSKMHKVIPSLLFKKDSFYFMNSTIQPKNTFKKENRNEEGKILNVNFYNEKRLDSESTLYKTNEMLSSID